MKGIFKKVQGIPPSKIPPTVGLNGETFTIVLTYACIFGVYGGSGFSIISCDMCVLVMQLDSSNIYLLVTW